MAEISEKYPENVPGVFYVDDQCIDCDLCRETAPENFRRNGEEGYSYVFKQPGNPEEESLCLEALEGCPVEAIGNNGDGIVRATKSDRHPIHSPNFPLDRDESSESSLDDDDRIDCPFCGCMHYPGSRTVEETGWVSGDDFCDHTLFVALCMSSFSGFEYRSKLFNQHLGLPDSDEAEVSIPSEENPEIRLSVDQIIDRITIPGLEMIVHEDGGGMACGPVWGGSVTYGFVPQKTNPD
jgi:ferredoxin